MDEIKLSIVLPLYNGERTIARTLDSIAAQDFRYPYEIVIVNDNSTDKSLEEVSKYLSILPIHLINVNLDVHCAGNSRNIGIDASRGEWVTFIDHDDEFEPNAFNTVFDIIEANFLEYICCTTLYEYNEVTGDTAHHTELHDNIDVWMHGKYYHKENLLDAYNLRFKTNLKYLEDLYFNCRTIEILFDIGIINKPTFSYYTVETYKWYEHPYSTHSKVVEGGYNFNLWGLANYYCEDVLEPIIRMAKKCRNKESLNALTRIAYADIAYVYVNYNVLMYYYTRQDVIVGVLANNVCKYIPQILQLLPITNIFDYVTATIETTIRNSGFSDEEIQKVITMSFPEWWGMMLTHCN